MKIIEYRKLLIAVGSVIILISLGLVFGLGLKPGIDFTGGSLMQVVYGDKPDVATIENSLSELNLGGYSLRSATDEAGRDGYILRTRDLTDDERVAVEEVMLMVGQEAEVTRFTSIGPVIGQELKEKAKWAVGGVLFVIVAYVSLVFWRVRWPVGSTVYGAITILALAHDVLVPSGLMALLGYFYGVEVDVLFVMALLAVLGYSVNDTIVVFDRVRENIIKYRTEHKKIIKETGGMQREEVSYTFNKPFAEIVGLSVNETLLRSINTSVTTALALVALYFFGGEVTKNFALILLVGVVAGAYSSICLASPLLVWYAERKEKNV